MVNFDIRPFKDEVLCDVVDMEACHVLLGRPWWFDRWVIHDCRKSTITVKKNGRKFVLIPLKDEEGGK